MANAPQKPLVNLLRGWPHASLLPTALVSRAASSALADPAVSLPGLLYGPDLGYERLRQSIASWLTAFYRTARPIPVGRIAITGGASQNLACILQVYTDPLYTRNIWMVAPSYFLAFRIFDDSGFHGKLRAVPEDDEGLDIALLRSQIRESEERAAQERNSQPTLKPPRPWSKIYRHVIYAVPTFSNPSSRTMSLRRREELVRLARDYDALVISDDVYDFLQWPVGGRATDPALSTAALPRAVDVDRFLDGGPERDGADGFGNVASNGSFSKIAGPGLRTGWVEGTEKFVWGVSQTGSTRSGGAPSHLTATFLAELLDSGDLQSYIAGVLQPAYASRHRCIVGAIRQCLFPLGITLPREDGKVAGGYFVWITLPEPLRAAGVSRRAQEDENLIVAEGAMFEVPGDRDRDRDRVRFSRDMRLCFSWEDEARLAEGIQRLANVIEKLQREEDRGERAQDTQCGTVAAQAYW